MRGKAHTARALLRLACLGLCFAIPACQGSSSGNGGPRPRSREAAGTNQNLPYETTTSNRKPIDDTGGELEFAGAKLTIPRGAVDQPVFFEVAEPEAQTDDRDILPGSAVQLNPNTLELKRDGLLTISYGEGDVPTGKSEEALVIVHKVNNIWVELSNSKVYTHDNIVEAPIRFMGLYALRLASDDPRLSNTMPVASFEFSDEPYADQHGESAADAEKRAVEEREQKNSGESGQEGAPGTGTAEPGAPGSGTAPPVSSPPASSGGNSANGPVAPPKSTSAIIKKFVGAPALTRKSSKKKGGTVKPGSSGGPKTTSKPLATGPVQPPSDDELLRQRREQDQLGATGGTGKSTTDEASAGGTAGAGEEKAAPSVAEAKTPVLGPAPGPVGEVTGEGAEVKVYFNASASSDPDGKVVQYDWDWNADGVFDYTSHSSAYAEHTYRFNGDYGVVLKVTDDGRYPQSAYAVGTVEVRSAKAAPKPLAANINAYPPFGPTPLTVHFAAGVTGGTAPYIYNWVFSDGSESNLPNPFTTYPEAGVFPVKFSVTDIKGAKLTGNLSINALGRPEPGMALPRIELTIDPSVQRGQAPYTAYFKLDPLRATGAVTYRVSYGDEEPGQDETVTNSGSLKHVYTNAGFYVVKIVATDADLRTASTFGTVNAMAAADARDFTASSAAFSGDPFSYGHRMRISYDYTGASHRTVRFGAVDTPKAYDQLAYNWDFGDGTFSTEAGPVHTYAKDGVYEVRVSASDDQQRWRTRIWLPIAEKKSAVAIQRPDYVEAVAPARLKFDAIITRGDEPLSYDWSFGDTRRSEASPVFSFDQAGVYKVNLTVKDKWSTTFTAPQIEVRVRPSPPDYKLPLAVIQPVTDGTRATVLDYTGFSPLPLSSAKIEGTVKLVDLSADGMFLAFATADAVWVKRVRDGAVLLNFMPAAGTIPALRVISAEDGPVALATVEGATGTATWMLRQGSDPASIGSGYLAAASGDGAVAVLTSKLDDNAHHMTAYRLDIEAGQASQGSEFAMAYEAALDAHGETAYFLGSDRRLVRRAIATGEDEFLSGPRDAKHGLTCSADGHAAAYATLAGGVENILYGRDTDSGFKLTSVTDQTGWASGYLRLSADGRYLLTHGSRNKLIALLTKAGKPVKADAKTGKSPVDGEESSADAPPTGDSKSKAGATDKDKSQPTEKPRERYGLVRLDLGASSDKWTIGSVNPRFIIECMTGFATAGPFD